VSDEAITFIVLGAVVPVFMWGRLGQHDEALRRLHLDSGRKEVDRSRDPVVADELTTCRGRRRMHDQAAIALRPLQAARPPARID
jgi:hypothetical protein